jgi:hypothetical protein
VQQLWVVVLVSGSVSVCRYGQIQTDTCTACCVEQICQCTQGVYMSVYAGVVLGRFCAGGWAVCRLLYIFMEVVLAGVLASCAGFVFSVQLWVGQCLVSGCLVAGCSWV